MSPQPRQHADYVMAADFPQCWRELNITADVEAKAKERAVLQLKRALEFESHQELARSIDAHLLA
jgi:UV DNA damage endonuclease